MTGYFLWFSPSNLNWPILTVPSGTSPSTFMHKPNVCLKIVDIDQNHIARSHIVSQLTHLTYTVHQYIHFRCISVLNSKRAFNLYSNSFFYHFVHKNRQCTWSECVCVKWTLKGKKKNDFHRKPPFSVFVLKS